MLARFLERLSLGIEKVAAVLLAAITVIVVASAVGRYGFARPIPDAFDVSRLLPGRGRWRSIRTNEALLPRPAARP